MTTEHKRMQERGDTDDAILAQHPVPLARELLVAHATGTTWVGDGVTA